MLTFEKFRQRIWSIWIGKNSGQRRGATGISAEKMAQVEFLKSQIAAEYDCRIDFEIFDSCDVTVELNLRMLILRMAGSYACMYVYVFVYFYVYICICICICTYMYVYTYTYINT